MSRNKAKSWEESAGFLMYREDFTLFQLLPTADDVQKVLFAVFRYAMGESIGDLSEIQKIAFQRIQKHMDDNRDAYNESLEKRRNAAAEKWKKERESKDMECTAMQYNAEQCSTMQYNADALHGVYVSDSESDSEYESDSVNNNIVDFPEAEKSTFSPQIEAIINYLNSQTGKRFRKSSPKTRKCITARLKEGFTENDFRIVIDKKLIEWGNNPQMEQYLRPETLFSTKFESYLNQQIVGKKLSPAEEFQAKIQSGYYKEKENDNEQRGNCEDLGSNFFGL